MRKIIDIELDENNTEDFTKSISNKKVRIIVKNQEVYILNMELPRVNGDVIREMIYQELCIRFNKSDNIMFDYSITESGKKSVNAAVFCFNWNGDDIINSIINAGGILEGVIPLQFYMLERYSRYIKTNDYYFVFFNNNNLYILEINKGILVMNRVLKDFDFKHQAAFKKDIKFIYHVNMDRDILNNCFGNGYELADLGDKI